jgi:MFS family permease
MPTAIPAQDPELQTSPALPESRLAAERARARQTRTLIIAAVAAGLVLIAILALAIYVLLQPGTPTDRWRDIFIIMVSLESLVIGVALVALLIQMASLINLLQNEVRPILDATSETVNTLRGTAEFLGESVVEPVIKLNGYLASLRRVLELMGIKHR